MTKIIHPVAGAVALITIATFWLSTALTELFASHETIAMVKTAIPWGFLLLIPMLAATGGSGFVLAKQRRAGLIGAKIRRMPFIAGNGILILIPAALFLAFKAKAAEFDTAFYAVQALELAAGATNIVLLGLNMRDGFKMKAVPFHQGAGDPPTPASSLAWPPSAPAAGPGYLRSRTDVQP
ncbi:MULTISPECIES: hypothetical protein [unclassified Bradyrhizobium]|uniref:hypothetical protein n=1 Tax=unclassified Bradyrhizobium TaxID=2631580 RepID=UPI001CD56630|nr:MULTISPECIES: hypothetical protein [unclassified Bradyrhizobium]